MMTVGSIFSGIGGIELGLERVGMTIKWQVEIDEYCREILEKHWPGVKRYGNIKDIDWSGVERVDLICGGFPCPPVSTAGKRRGSNDERWMWPEFIRCLRTLKPRWVLVENVRGLLSVNNGREFGEILRDLAESGYDAEWFLLGAKDVGAPHKRNRTFILAYPKRHGREHSTKPQEKGNRAPAPQERPERDSQEHYGVASEGYSIRPQGKVARNRLPLWPPNHEDEEAWAKILRQWPELAPATAAESEFLRVVDGVSTALDGDEDIKSEK